MIKGFTLIELLVVLVIISLVSAFVAPRITAPIGGLQLKTAAKKIAGAMRYSRSLAVSEKQVRTCVFDFDNNRMAVFSGDAPGLDGLSDDQMKAGAEFFYPFPAGVSLEKAMFGDTTIETGLFQVVFFTNGSASGGEIYLANEKGRSFRIAVDFITGMVALTEPDTAAS